MKPSDDSFLRLIAVFKFLKAASLIALSVGVFRLLHKDVGKEAEHWVNTLKLDPGNRFVDLVLARAAKVSPQQIKELGVGGLLYAALFLTEGTGLWLRKRWGEWLTVILTSTLVPLEIYEIHRHPSVSKVVVLTINVAIVGYLAWRIRTEQPHSK
jgi:uncharacterized membrane protein (DUF2068 family)